MGLTSLGNGGVSGMINVASDSCLAPRTLYDFGTRCLDGRPATTHGHMFFLDQECVEIHN